MVLMDTDGGRIHATIKKTLIYKFKDELEQGKVYSFENLGVSANSGAYRTTQHCYKLNFQFTSVVQRLNNHEVVKSPFALVPIADVVGGSYDTDYLLDVIGVLTGVGSEREITNQNGTTTKLNVIELEAAGHKLQCTLFGPYVDELNTFIAAGDYSNAVVIVQLAKAKTFQDKLHIQNCMNCTRLFFNPNCEESRVLRESLPVSIESPSPITLTQIQAEPAVRPVEEFLFNTPRTTLQGLKDATTESIHVVCVTVKRVLNPDCWWYTACVCNKSVIPDSNMFYCEKCNKHVSKVFPRYCLKIRVMDQTDHATFVIFDKDASSLFNMSCADMFESNQRLGGVGVVPPQIGMLADKNWLFKVETKPTSNPRFEQTFREAGSLSTLLEKGKDVLAASSTNILSEDLFTLTGSSSKEKGKEIVVDCTPVEFSQDLMNKFSDTVVNLDDDSIGTQEIDRSLISSKVTHSLTARSDKGKAKDVVDDGAPVGGIDSDNMVKKRETVVTKGAGETLKSAESVITPKGAKSNKELHGVSVVDADFIESQQDMVTPNQLAANESKVAKSKKLVKRVSPQKEEDAEDDNAPIKLLKRAVKIEKIV
ncbi:hypothetical protein TSUD_401960 [Trifolium subterraneum]|uniref:Replication factor A C-terminal domain-containing protein n=1 Tax=Trifolium subterraneum TaxID=3900 RepID=A0A2Z6PLU8_TRISU|nr:hypothetical protein TSUD_401960 [Trifolium subterraneum]